MPNVQSPRNLISRPDNMDETVLHTSKSTSFILDMVSLKILNRFSKIYIFCRHVNKTISSIWTKAISNVEDYSDNISVEILNIPIEMVKLAK